MMFSNRWLWILSLLLFNCGHAVQIAPPLPPVTPPPAQNVFVLLPEPDGKPSGIVLTNPAGTQTLTKPFEAVTVERAGAAPSAPFAIDPQEVRRRFGATLDALPAPELSFLVYFGEGSDTLTPESQEQLKPILDAIRERRSTSISVIGHTDTTATPQFNYQLGLRRARAVAAIVRQRGVADSDLFVESHGETDLLVPTEHGRAEQRNRRVEIIVR